MRAKRKPMANGRKAARLQQMWNSRAETCKSYFDGILPDPIDGIWQVSSSSKCQPLPSVAVAIAIVVPVVVTALVPFMDVVDVTLVAVPVAIEVALSIIVRRHPP